MENINELAFKSMLDNVKLLTNDNSLVKLAVDKLSYVYNRGQYHDWLLHIDDENKQIANIFNQISQSIGFVTIK